MIHVIINIMVVEKTKIAINIIIAIASNILMATTIMVVTVNMTLVAMVVMAAFMEIVAVASLAQIRARTVVITTKIISTAISSRVVNREFLFVEFTIRLHASPESTKETLTVSLSSLFTYAQRHVSL